MGTLAVPIFLSSAASRSAFGSQYQMKGHEMKTRSIAACMMIATAGVSSLALGAPPHGAQATHTRANVAQAAGTASSGGVDYSFQAQAFIDVDGSLAGSVYVESFGGSPAFQFISCSGPEFANVVSMNQSTGAVTVNAALDRTNPNCFSFPDSSGPSMTLKLSGQPDGSYRNAQSGTGTEQISGSTFKYNFQSDEFGESFIGSTGFYTGTFSGRALSARSTNRTQVK